MSAALSPMAAAFASRSPLVVETLHGTGPFVAGTSEVQPPMQTNIYLAGSSTLARSYRVLLNPLYPHQGTLSIINATSMSPLSPYLKARRTAPAPDSLGALRFRALAAEWHRATDHLSTTADIVLHPAYLKIIGMGEAALPFILREFESGRNGHWFIALASIVGESLVSDSATYDQALRAWLEWGRARGYVGVSR